MDFTHLDKDGNCLMVDVSNKDESKREAIAYGKILLNEEIISKLIDKDMPKGDVLATARIAGIMAVKKTASIIPMCHTIIIDKAKVDFNIDEKNNIIEAFCTVKTTGKTGVEMEALTGVNIALLTIYDMCKALSKDLEIREVYLLEKSGGKSGLYKRRGR